MKLIDLLNKIANGEKIKAFKYDEYIFKYDTDRENWKNENGDILSTYCNVEVCLNDEIEIISTPTIEDLQTRINKAKDYLETCMINPEDLSLYENITKEECLKLLDILRGEE